MSLLGDLEWSPYDNRALNCSLCNALKGAYDPLELGEEPLVLVTGQRRVLLAQCRAEVEKRRVDADRDWCHARRLILHPCDCSDQHAVRRPNIATRTNSPLFHTHIVVDWSARSEPSPEQPSKDAIWWADVSPPQPSGECAATASDSAGSRRPPAR